MSTVNARAFSAAQDFLLGAKKFWTTQMYPQLQEQERAQASGAEVPVQERVQSNDVTVDDRGLIYLLDRVRGLSILERT